jgi:hypothetical protein
MLFMLLESVDVIPGMLDPVLDWWANNMDGRKLEGRIKVEATCVFLSVRTEFNDKSGSCGDWAVAVGSMDSGSTGVLTVPPPRAVVLLLVWLVLLALLFAGRGAPSSTVPSPAVPGNGSWTAGAPIGTLGS